MASSTRHYHDIERNSEKIPLILMLDVAGQPIGWENWKPCVTMAVTGKIKWSLGEKIILRGGINRLGEQSIFELPSIIASADVLQSTKIPLTNRELFKRDRHICMYCGQRYGDFKLTRDHIIPVSKGGPNTWMNCVTACRTCNAIKADRTPEEAQMPLRAVPYEPSPAAFLLLQNRHRILGDQMEYLEARLDKHERKKLLAEKKGDES